MARVSESRLKVWIYQELMGTLGKKKRELLREELNEKQGRGDLEPIERRIWAAMKLHSDREEQRAFIERELEIWEKKRTSP